MYISGGDWNPGHGQGDNPNKTQLCKDDFINHEIRFPRKKQPGSFWKVRPFLFVAPNGKGISGAIGLSQKT